ncbi:MAG: Hexuronate transporter [Bacteroidia bacterium]|nr:Hexuronate transporter [Bacteroidia bacterium]
MSTDKTLIGSYRWRICALLFFATTVNYIDRNVLSFAMIDGFFRKEMLGLPEDAILTQADTDRFKEMMGYVDAAFKMAYALGFLIMGYVIDKFGTRKGFSVAISVWSIAGVLNGFVGSVKGLVGTRFLLGLGEAGNFPSAVKTVAEWFPRKERSFAAGLFNAGANIGVIVTALAVPFITVQYGWRASFVATGLLGFAVLIFWRLMYRKPEEHPQLSMTEFDYINSDKDETSGEKISWLKLLQHRQTWAFAVGKFMADPIWYFYLTWLPDFFNSSESLEQKLDLKNIGLPFIIIYLVSDGGSIFFGWLSSRLIQKGWSVNNARKITMLICALCVVPIVFASTTSSVAVAVALIALAAAAHQGWSANMYTLASDMFPKSNVGSVVGIGSMFGAIGGVLFAASTGIIRVKFGYIPLFAIAGSAYLIALVLIHLLAPKLDKIETVIASDSEAIS